MRARRLGLHDSAKYGNANAHAQVEGQVHVLIRALQPETAARQRPENNPRKKHRGKTASNAGQKPPYQAVSRTAKSNVA